jgi:hypothetical protein
MSDRAVCGFRAGVSDGEYSVFRIGNVREGVWQVDGGEAETERVAFTVFHLTHLGVVAEVVAAFHELVRLYGKSLLFAEAALGIEAFVLLVNASYNLPDDSLFLA